MYIRGFIYLRISGDGLNMQETTKTLGIIPCISDKKGDIKNLKNLEQIVCKEDCWMSQYEIPHDKEFNIALSEFVEQYIPNAEYINKISQSYNVTLWCSIYPEKEQININFPFNIIKKIYELGIDIDLSVAYLKTFYEGTY